MSDVGPAKSSTAPREAQRRSLPLMRRVMIESLMRSRAATLPVTLTAEAPVGELVAAHKRLREMIPGLTFGMLIAKLLIGVLRDHPFLNAAIVDGDLVEYSDVQLGCAVALDDGELVVPVLHRAQEMSLPVLAKAMRDLIARARSRKLVPADVQGGTFSLSNVGNVRSLAVPFTATPVIPPNQSGIILTGLIRPAPLVVEGHVTVAEVMPIAFSFDHRIVNGVPALTALGEFIRRLNDPKEWFQE
ncbi:MAG TPA: 2-oxo acid dehydrogenase subunit E2 [Steroidobacteraceae bacterium]|nr:2-oxo acid dehydrogenase subunit E2 [Steroidobacteraceae bacterium]